jgi:hypothetical protein
MKKVWVKPNGEMPFLYGNHVLKAHLGRITEDTPEHQGVVVYSMNDVPLVNELCVSHSLSSSVLVRVQGFGVTSRSTVDTRKLDPTAIVVFHQAYVSANVSSLPSAQSLLFQRCRRVPSGRGNTFQVAIVHKLTYSCRIPCSDK